ncbi:MAG TPA: YigZ family protein [Firmicutes bacterium]|nr:YigZ family protein [Bacillota bacterium]
MGSSYKTVAQSATWETKIQRSVFIGHTRSVDSEAEAKAFLAKVREEHTQATHNCYAYRLGLRDLPLEYYNDHGEPAGTAGRPILNAILQADLYNTIVVVTRYFGGKKLGIRGLIDAYHSTAVQTLTVAGVKEILPRFSLSVTCAYSQLAQVNYILQQFAGLTETIDYSANVKLQVLLPEEYQAEAISALSALSGVELVQPDR